MKFAIIVVNYNTQHAVLGCLASIKSLQVEDHKLLVFVVDNASSDNSCEKISKSYPEFNLIKNSKNIGFSAANNIAIKTSLEKKADYILILNPDTKCDPRLIIELQKAIIANPKAGILAPKIYFYPGFEFHKNRYDKKEEGKVLWYAGGKIDWQNVIASHRGVDEVDNNQYQKIEPTDFATGAAMLVKKEVFEKIGFLDERYFLYLEDVEFCVRAKKKKFEILYTPKAIVWHKWAQSTTGGSKLQDYFITRNRLLFGLKYASFRTKLALIKQAIKFIFATPTKRQAVLDFFQHRFGEGSLKKFI